MLQLGSWHPCNRGEQRSPQWFMQVGTAFVPGGKAIALEVRGFFEAGEIVEKKQREKEYFVMPHLLLCPLEPSGWNRGICEILTEPSTIFCPLWLVGTVVKIDSFQPSSSLLLQTTIVKVAGIAFLCL